MIRRVSVVAALLAFAGCAGTDTGGRRLEEAKILGPDGSVLHPQTIEHAPSTPAGYPGGVGIGIGGGSWGSRSGAVVGSGVSIGVPVGGSSRGQGTTLTYFPLDQAGPAPWRLRVKLAEIEPVIIVVGGPPQRPK